MTRDEEDAILAQAEQIKQTRSAVYLVEAEAIERRVKQLWDNPTQATPFTPDELRYAAGARCQGCAQGLAYPKNIGMRGSWSCSAILLGTAAHEIKHDLLPFMFYEIKSEDQPSARGATTRPA